MKKMLIPLLVMISLAVSGCELLGGQKQPLVLPQQVSQWASAASASSAFGGLLSENKDDQSPYAATGEPDTDKCGDSPNAWVSDGDNKGLQWLEVEFPLKVYVNAINIRESFGPGAVRKVELNDGDKYITFWEGKDVNRQCPGFFQVSYSAKEANVTRTMTQYRSDRARIWVDTSTDDWNEIDAVQLVGYEYRWYVVNNTVVME